LQQCSHEEVLAKLEKAMRSTELRTWLENTAKAFAAALAGIAERRMSDVVAAIFLAQVGSSFYAAARASGKPPEDSLEEAVSELCRVFVAAVRLLKDTFSAGRLEESFERVVRWLEKGSE
jgi:hypothetical protein